MKQNTPVAVPTMDSGKQSNEKGLKIAVVIVSIVAVCGIGFGVYGMVQSLQKDNQISDLKVQIKENDGTITTIETPEIETTTDNGTTITIADSAKKDINDNESIKLYYYVSSGTDSGIYSLVLALRDNPSIGSFDLIQSGGMFNDSAAGYVDIANGEISLSVGPFVGDNDFTSATTISRDMGFSFAENAGRQENYKGYKSTFSEEKITLGDIVLERVN